MTPEGVTWIVMERAIKSLSHFIRSDDGEERPLTMAEMACVAQQCFSALEYLHAKGLTHRDLKAENMLVFDADETQGTLTIKLTDFGGTGTREDLRSLGGTEDLRPPEIMAAIRSGVPYEDLPT